MILNDNLYTVAAMDMENRRVCVTLCRDSVIYRAHFPERPVTPGVCVIQMAVELLELLLGHKYVLLEVPNAKFLSVISPQDTPQVSLAFSKLVPGEEGNVIKADVVAVAMPAQNVCAKLTLLCKTS